MTTFYGWLAIIVFIVAVVLTVWDMFFRKPPEDEVWVDEDDVRREPNWRRI